MNKKKEKVSHILEEEIYLTPKANVHFFANTGFGSNDFEHEIRKLTHALSRGLEETRLSDSVILSAICNCLIRYTSSINDDKIFEILMKAIAEAYEVNKKSS